MQVNSKLWNGQTSIQTTHRQFSLPYPPSARVAGATIAPVCSGWLSMTSQSFVSTPVTRSRNRIKITSTGLPFPPAGLLPAVRASASPIRDRFRAMYPCLSVQEFRRTFPETRKARIVPGPNRPLPSAYLFVPCDTAIPIRIII